MRFRLRLDPCDDLSLFPHWPSRLLLVALGVVLIALPWLVGPYPLGLTTTLALFVVAGAGTWLLYAGCGLVSLGHAAFLAIGAYGEVLATRHGLPAPAGLVVATMLGALFGGLLALPTLRLRGLYFAMATFAFAEIVHESVAAARPWTAGYEGMLVPPLRVAGIDLGRGLGLYFTSVALAAGALWLLANLTRAPLGRQFAAVRESEVAARSLGIDVLGTKARAMALSGALTALAGALFAHKLGYLSPESFRLMQSLELVVLVVVGGAGSLVGIVLGASMIALLPVGIALVREQLPVALADTPGLESGVFGLLLLGFVLFEPEGLAGRWKKCVHYLSHFPLVPARSYARQRRYQRSERLQ